MSAGDVDGITTGHLVWQAAHTGVPQVAVQPLLVNLVLNQAPGHTGSLQQLEKHHTDVHFCIKKKYLINNSLEERIILYGRRGFMTNLFTNDPLHTRL